MPIAIGRGISCHSILVSRDSGILSIATLILLNPILLVLTARGSTDATISIYDPLHHAFATGLDPDHSIRGNDKKEERGFGDGTEREKT